MGVLPHEVLARTLRAVCHAIPFRGRLVPTPRVHPGLRRAGTTALVLGLAAALTGCSAQGQEPPAPDLTSVPPTAGGTAPATAPAPGGEHTTAPGTCFDVIEVYTGLVLLPITLQEPAGGAPADASGAAGEETAGTAPLREAEESITSHRDRLPTDVRPAFDRAARLLQESGESLQPGEAARLQRGLDPVEGWISEQCSAAVPGS